MGQQEFQVDGMTCGHCIRSVTEAVRGVDPVAAVDVDLATGRVRIGSDAAPDRLTAAIVAEGYAAAVVMPPLP